MANPAQRPPVALSTMWAVQPPYERDLAAFARLAAEAGYGAVEINHSMDRRQAAELLACSVLPVASVHAPAPLEDHPRLGPNRVLNLASDDAAERTAAIGYTARSFDLARRAGARFVVVHLGQIGGAPFAAETRLRELYAAGQRSGEPWQQAIDDARRERARLAPRALAQAASTLHTLAPAAEAAGVTIGLESRLEYHHIPLPAEAAELLAPYAPQVAGYWHDSGHSEVLHRLGLVPLEDWWRQVGPRLVGLHVHDVRGLVDHRAPGNGDLDFRALAAHIPAGAAITLEIDQHEPAADLARALDVLRAAGVW
ncbi:MAG: sugar phosphate isomerase/epimerase [Dehalococcoidia bacterium]|nr:sugar phosphate isomerase/epimerase [Dehalococcoidia bacterium]